MPAAEFALESPPATEDERLSAALVKLELQDNTPHVYRRQMTAIMEASKPLYEALAALRDEYPELTAYGLNINEVMVLYLQSFACKYLLYGSDRACAGAIKQLTALTAKYDIFPESVEELITQALHYYRQQQETDDAREY